MEIERRVFPVADVEFRQDGDKMTFRGYAAVFNQLSDPIGGMFREKISPGAFTKTIKEGDVRLLINHNPDMVLARSRAGKGTLRLSEDSTGLLVEADMAPTTYARDLSTVMQRGEIDQMSFGFQKVKDVWDRSNPDMPVRDLKENRLFDVSPVTFPAYPQTTAEVRNAARGLMMAAGIDAPPLDLSGIDLDLALAYLTSDEERVGKAISAANADKIRAAIESLEKLLGMNDEPVQTNSARAYPMIAGQLCPLCGVPLMLNEQDQVYCFQHGVEPQGPLEIKSLQIEHGQRERQLRLLALRAGIPA